MKINVTTSLLLICLFLITCSRSDNSENTPIDDDLAGPISRPSSGYGSDGKYTVAKITFPSPTYSGKNVEIFYFIWNREFHIFLTFLTFGMFGKFLLCHFSYV